MLPWMSLRAGVEDEGNRVVGNLSPWVAVSYKEEGATRPFAAGCTSVPAWSQ